MQVILTTEALTLNLKTLKCDGPWPSLDLNHGLVQVHEPVHVVQNCTVATLHMTSWGYILTGMGFFLCGSQVTPLSDQTFHGFYVAMIGMPFAKVTVELMNCKLPRATGFSLLATGWTTSDADGHFDTVKGPEMPSHMLVGWIGGGFSSEVLGECIGWLLDDEETEGWGLWGCVGVLAWSLPSMGSGNTGLSSSLPRFDPDAIILLNAVLALLFIHSSISSSLNLENFAVSFSHACFKRMTSFLVEMYDGSQNFLRGHLLMTMW